jgi:predicted O-methyltransferase YrrM
MYDFLGFSTVSMAKTVKSYGGKITTIDFSAKGAEQAVKNFEREQVADQIEVRIGDARRQVYRGINVFSHIPAEHFHKFKCHSQCQSGFKIVQ